MKSSSKTSKKCNVFPSPSPKVFEVAEHEKVGTTYWEFICFLRNYYSSLGYFSYVCSHFLFVIIVIVINFGIKILKYR